STIEHGGTSGSVCGPEDESNVESSHARRRSSFINQAPHDPSKRPMITLDGGGFADTKVSRTITTIFKNMFNGSWTTWKEGNKSDHDELWAYFKKLFQWEVVTDVLVREVWEDTMKNRYPNIMLKARNDGYEIKTVKGQGYYEKSLSKYYELTHTKKGTGNGLHEFMKLKAELVWAAYKEAVVAKYGPNSYNHPIFDFDLWEYCSKEVTKGGLERGLWNMLIAAAGAFSSDLEQIHDFVFGMGQNRDVQNTLPGLVFFLMSLPKGVFRICLLLQQGRLVPT
ncbi:hypothetical protein Tco_0853631, partial [Tanacetum coccineum]